MKSERIKIYIYSGKVHSGKTTRIMEWAKSQKSADGIFAPVINSKRYLVRIKSGEMHLLEADENEDEMNIIKIGNYKFLKNIFEWAQNELLKAFESNPGWLIIDEIGFLELKTEGLEPAVSKIIYNNKISQTKLLLIIRENLLGEVIKHFGFISEDCIIFEI